MVSSLGNKQKLSSDFQCITQYQTEPIDFASRLVTLSKSWIFSSVVLNLHLTSQLSGWSRTDAQDQDSGLEINMGR